MYGALPVLVFLLMRFLIAGRARGGARGRTRRATETPGSSWLQYAWAFFVGGSIVGGLLSVALPSELSLSTLAWTVCIASPACALCSAVPVLRALARLGRPRLVHVLAHVLLVFPRTGETRAGATLLAALAIAHRGPSTPEERAWLREGLNRETRTFGAFACACAILELIEARAARDEGRAEASNEATSRAGAILGTLTTASPAAASRLVRRLTVELLASLEAERGEWGYLADLPEKGAAPWMTALRGYFEERLAGRQPSPRTERARRRARSPVIEAVFARERGRPALPAGEMIARGRAAFLAMSRGEPVGVQAKMWMLIAFDALMSPQYEGTVIPVEARADMELVGALQDEVADTLASLIAPHPPPICALAVFGPISARVHQKLESILFDRFSRMAAGLRERVKEGWRHDAVREWTDASTSRLAFRQIERALGHAAAARVWPEYARAYGNLGVLLSETLPRRRPLAHAVFVSVRRDATRFGDSEIAAHHARNARLTKGLA